MYYKDVDNELRELINQGKTGREIESILKIARRTMYCKLKKLGLHIPNYHNALKFDNTVFDNIDTEEKAYWLGFLYADGYVSSTVNTVEVSLKADDIDHLHKFKEFLHLQKNIEIGQVTCLGKKFSRCRVSVTDKHFHDRLVELGCTPKKSLTLTFPPLNIFSKEDLVIHFIRGYIDGDGCLTYTSTGRLVISIIGTFEFLGGIINILPSIFDRPRRKDKRSKNNTYVIECSCVKADKLANLLYNNAVVYLDRKYERYKRFAVPIEKSLELLEDNIGEGCDANTEITEETKESSVL